MLGHDVDKENSNIQWDMENELNSSQMWDRIWAFNLHEYNL